jgi:large subunit ribosomal protein L7e
MVATELKPKVDGEALKVAKVVLKRRDRNLQANAARAKKIQELRKMRKSKPTIVKAVNADDLLRKCQRVSMDKQHVIVAKNKRSLERKIPASATSLLVARNLRVPELPKTKGALAKMGIFFPNECRIIPTTPENLALIRLSDAYIYYGVPTPEIISTLVHKKACVSKNVMKQTTEEPREPTESKQDASTTPLNNNAIVEDILGDLGLICVEDLVDVLVKGKDDERFAKVTRFIAPFKINGENVKLGSKFRNSRPSRGFQPKIETIMNRII